jgi:hypothetical protein
VESFILNVVVLVEESLQHQIFVLADSSCKAIIPCHRIIYVIQHDADISIFGTGHVLNVRE